MRAVHFHHVTQSIEGVGIGGGWRVGGIVGWLKTKGLNSARRMSFRIRIHLFKIGILTKTVTIVIVKLKGNARAAGCNDTNEVQREKKILVRVRSKRKWKSEMGVSWKGSERASEDRMNKVGK